MGKQMIVTQGPEIKDQFLVPWEAMGLTENPGVEIWDRFPELSQWRVAASPMKRVGAEKSVPHNQAAVLAWGQ